MFYGDPSANPQQKSAALLQWRAEHIVLQTLFYLFERADSTTRGQIKAILVGAVTVHMQVEDEVLYPAARALLGAAGAALANAARGDREIVTAIVAQIDASGSGRRHVSAWVRVLRDQVERHIADIERSLLPLLRGSDMDLRDLDSRLAARKAELTLILEIERARTRPSGPVSTKKPVQPLGEPKSPSSGAGKVRLRLVSREGPLFVEEYKLSRH
jgi:hypothetical protein